MTREEYDQLPGLNFSGLKDLAISPLRYWARHVDPHRVKEEPTPEMELGTALHVAVLEPSKFDSLYYPELDVSAVEGLLVTIDDIREYLRGRSISIPAGANKRKEELVRFALEACGDLPILDVLQASHGAANAGKRCFKREDWVRIAGMAQALADEPRLQKLLDQSAGEPEAVLNLCVDGVILKGRLDWLGIDSIVDLKTFAQKSGKSIDKSITDAIFYEKYHWQAVFYSMLRGWPEWRGDYVLAFVESEPPHETRLRSIRAKTGGNVNLLWERARIEIRQGIRTYKECMDHFGVEKPWRYAQEVTPLADEEFSQLAFS